MNASIAPHRVSRASTTGTGGQLALGVDVGGTSTDAVVLDVDNTVLAWAKQPTTDDVIGGIRAAVAAVLARVGNQRHEVTRVMMGTTHATNAIVGRQDLGRVAAIRLGAPAATAYPPLIGWPETLRRAVLADAAMLPGGHMIDGRAISPLDPAGIRRFLGDLQGQVDAVAITGIFSPSFQEQEQDVEVLVRQELGPEIPVTLSHDIGAVGLLERENATIINASLYQVARSVTQALLTVVDEEGLEHAAVFFAQNDGTLMALEFATRYPVLTIGSGPANSIRGAAHLSGVEHAIVVDVGGTTSDLGVVVNGFPRESTLPREIGGVRTNFRMPDILSVGVGGGTIVGAAGALGPESVGYRLQEAALSFGGDTPTLTDAAVLQGRAVEALAGRRIDTDDVTQEALHTALERAHQRLTDSVERLSFGNRGTPLVVVGGGAFLVPDDLAGAATVLRPGHGDVANAVGAAMSLVGGRAQEISSIAERDDAVARASQSALDRAIEAGADPLSVEVVDIDETPISYSAQQTIRIAAKAAGPLAPLNTRAPAS